MIITDALLGEHGAFYAMFDRLESLASSAGAVQQVQTASAILEALIASHATIEDALLFRALEPSLGKEGPLAVMRAEHEEIRRALERIEDAEDVAHSLGHVATALRLARSHFQKEEAVLFNLARRLLSQEELVALGSAWARVRHVTIE